MKRHFIFAVVLLFCGCLRIFAQAPHMYFTLQQMPNALNYMPAPPAVDEMRFAYDTAQYRWGLRMRHTTRGDKAKADAEYSIARMATIFSPVMGVDISPEYTPAIWQLLVDATETAQLACDIAKQTYMRPRPYMFFNEPSLIPEDEEVLRTNGSYPSGHTTLGWTTALLLIEINSDAQDALLNEGYEYGQSRVIAGYHWQSDVDAARVITSAAVARLHTSKIFQQQLRKAQREFKRLQSRQKQHK